MPNGIIYEQPLNERVRTFLRLEHLFEIVIYHAAVDSEYDTRSTINSMLSIVDLLSRTDIKSELSKELERHSNTLNALRENPGVDQARLNKILENINSLLGQLRDKSCQPGQLIKQNELITSVKQRSTIPGGSCNFDLPGYHFWLNKPYHERNNIISEFRKDLNVIEEAVGLSLHMIRNSTTPTNETAESGFFQKPIESNIACQLIRVILAEGSRFYPEISGGKHRFTVRFLEQADTYSRPIQTEEKVCFELHCCIL